MCTTGCLLYYLSPAGDATGLLGCSLTTNVGGALSFTGETIFLLESDPFLGGVFLAPEEACLLPGLPPDSAVFLPESRSLLAERFMPLSSLEDLNIGVPLAEFACFGSDTVPAATSPFTASTRGESVAFYVLTCGPPMRGVDFFEGG